MQYAGHFGVDGAGSRSKLMLYENYALRGYAIRECQLYVYEWRKLFTS
jgi:hypothetical protein